MPYDNISKLFRNYCTLSADVKKQFDAIDHFNILYINYVNVQKNRPKYTDPYIMTFEKYTEVEIKELKWNNRKDFMLLGYGEQNNSLRSLPEDLIRSIAVCL